MRRDAFAAKTVLPDTKHMGVLQIKAAPNGGARCLIPWDSKTDIRVDALTEAGEFDGERSTSTGNTSR